MAGHLIICWNRESITIVESTKSGSTAEIRSVKMISWPEGGENLSNAELGEWVKTQLSELKVSAETCNVVVNREMTMHRKVEIPHVPEDEVYDLIKFQAATKLSTPLDQLVIDYVSIHDSAVAAQQSIMVVALAKKTIERIKQAVGTAGLELRRIQVSSHSLVELATHANFPEDSQQHAAVFSAQNQRLEFAIYANRTCQYSHSTKLIDDSASGLQRQISVELSRAALGVGKKASEIAVAFTGETSGTTFSGIDPGSLPSIRIRSSDENAQVRGWMGIAAGSLLSDIDSRTQTIDFLNPRRPLVKPDYTKQKRIGIAAAVALTALLAWGFWQWHLVSLDSQIAELQIEDKNLKNQIKAEAPTFESYADLAAWDRKRANFLVALDEVNSKLPGTNQVYIEELSMTPGVKDSPLRVTATGQAKRRSDVETTFSLMTNSGFLVNPSEISRNLVDRDYPYRLDLDASQIPESKTKTDDSNNSTEKKGR